MGRVRRLRPRALPRLYKLAWLTCGAREGAAEDLVQETLARTLAKWTSITAAGREPYPYARQILMHLSVDTLRARARRTLAETLWSARTSTHQQVSAFEGTDLTALDRLTAHQRRVVVCRFLEDLSVTQTAQVLSISENNVKITTSRAMAALRVVLSKENSHG